LSDRLERRLDDFKIPVGNGRMSKKTKGRSLVLLSGIKKNIVVKAASF
jgi:hypothetical protein